MSDTRLSSFILCALLAFSLTACDLASISGPERAEPAAQSQADRIAGVSLQSSLREALVVTIIDIDFPEQKIIAEREGKRFPVNFSADISIFPSGVARGKLFLDSRAGGLALELEAVSGQGFFSPDGALDHVELTLETSKGDLVQATATPVPGVPGCDIWDFMGTGIHDADGVTFEATGQIVVR